MLLQSDYINKNCQQIFNKNLIIDSENRSQTKVNYNRKPETEKCNLIENNFSAQGGKTSSNSKANLMYNHL